MEGVADASPRRKARLAGAFYLLNIVTGSLALFFAGRGLEGSGDASNLVATACYVVVTVGVFHLSLAGISPLVFFGAYCLLIGYLILRSTFLPAVLGVLMVFGGLGWLTFLSPTLAAQLKPFNLLPGVLGETVLTVWLLAKGVNVERWRAQESLVV